MRHTHENGSGRHQRGITRSALPLALIGAGAYWLYHSNRRGGDALAGDQGYTEYSEVDFGRGPINEGGAGGLRGVGGRLGDLAGKARERVEHRPLALAAIAIAAGFLIGLALPESDRERRLLGETRDRLMNKAQDAARDATQRVREAVGLGVKA